MRNWIVTGNCMAALLVLVASASAQLPEGPSGIASRYPGDRGMESDPQVVFVESFDGTLERLRERWTEVSNPNDNLALDSDRPAGSAFTQSLRIRHVGGQGTGAGLFRPLDENHDRVFARWYVKFDPESAPMHHFGTHLGGYNPASRWPQPNAGERPPGNLRFTTGIEPFGDAWRWDFYTYWSEMRSSPPRWQSWGNDFVNEPGLKVDRGRWICVEMMLRMNDPGDRNGEQAFWIDGQLVRRDGQVISHLGKGFPRGEWTVDSWHSDPNGEPFDGFQWRTVPELGVNNVWTYIYITKAKPGQVSRIWFSNIVLAKDYIGPISP